MINELFKYIDDNGIKGTKVFVELCAAPDKAPFYRKLGFDANEGQSLNLFREI